MIGFLADIHGNAWALEAVLADARRRRVSEFVNLGDVLYGPLAPRRTFELLTEINLVAQVRGNQDRLILDGPENPTLDWVRCDLGEGPLRWLADLPLVATYQNWLLCHGSPASDTCYLLEDVSGGLPRVRTEREIENLLQGNKARWIGCGHTHVQRLVRLNSGKTVVNPGSVGLPAYDEEVPVPHVIESFSPHARYASVEDTTVSFHLVEYDWNTAARKATELGRPDWARGIATGRMA